MKIAVHILAYNVDLTINSMLKNVGPWVDRIYIAYPNRPFDYIPESRDTKRNPTRLELIDAGEFNNKVIIIHGDWEKEEDTRNACLDLAREEGFDWLIIQDADEFYTEESWTRIRKYLYNNKNSEVLITTWYNFWKSSHFVIVERDGGIKGTNAGFAVRCLNQISFRRARTANAEIVSIIDEPCYHYGYVKTDEEMYEKVTTWGHAHQFNGPKWYRLKWEHWNLWTENIGPVTPTSWKRAIRFPYIQPEFAHEFALEGYFEKTKPINVRIEEFFYDQNASIKSKARFLAKGKF